MLIHYTHYTHTLYTILPILYYLRQPWGPIGLAALDYFLADQVAMPAELHAPMLRGSGTSERLALLPRYYSFYPREEVELPDDRCAYTHYLPYLHAYPLPTIPPCIHTTYLGLHT
jgi:hypothetical protein